MKKPKVNLIGISGKARSGKDYFASYLNEYLRNHGYQSYEIKKYGDPLKDVCRILTGSDNWETSEDKNEFLDKYGMTKRKFMQSIGTDCIRSKHDNAWIIARFNTYDKTTSWIVSDVRFPNEARAIKERGGIVLRIESNRPGVGTQYHPTDKLYQKLLMRMNLLKPTDHPSETALDTWSGFDYVINNNGTLELFESAIESFAASYLFKRQVVSELL